MLDIHEVGRSPKRGAIWISNISDKGRSSLLWEGSVWGWAPGGGDGIWLFTSLPNKLLKADIGQGRAGPRWLEGPSVFSFVGKSLCRGVQSLNRVSAVLSRCPGEIFFFIFILLGLPGAWFPTATPVLKYFQPLSFPHSLPSSTSEALAVILFNHLTLSYVSYTLFFIF